ncbi:hypothetical protein B0T14DRAFT_570402 [Immersiella caudata]|uniref:Uncharacterized protein n=1 Tax=Immersiella caudata TaxID=314043 RepID=A0AA40BUU6_9PEZI|nr:hypothetical protein B0T14DRAFT_570402 [Immersiella caudata]
MSTAPSATPSAETPSRAENPKPKRHKARALTREEVIEVRALKKYARWTHDQIVAATGFTINQVQVACKGTPRYSKKVDRWTVGAGATAGTTSAGQGGQGGSGSLGVDEEGPAHGSESANGGGSVNGSVTGSSNGSAAREGA